MARLPWQRDPHLWGALLLAVTLRTLPLLLWGWASDDCTRDECIFKISARPILAGDGLGLAPKGWLPAPGYPYLLATCHALFGRFEAVKWVQIALSLPLLATLHGLGQRIGGLKAARWLIWGFAVHPTFVFYAGTMWTETVYTALLLPTVLTLLAARDGGPRRALLPGFLLGLCVLNRGIATWLAPIFALALVTPDAVFAGRAAWSEAWAARARHVAAFVGALVLTVAPYSLAASARWGGPLVSDATLGHVITMGNDAYPPVTFDYGIGQLTGKLYARTLNHGRPDCPHDQGPLAYDRCEVSRSIAWIGGHPQTFVERVPVRWAQLLNPHSFLTRHVRWGLWPGMPWALKELLVTGQVVCTWIVLAFGSFAMWSRARGPFAVVTVGTGLYYLAVIGATYGLTRFRLPLEPLWMVAVAAWLADPKSAWDDLRASPVRLAGAAFTLALVTGFMAVYVRSGFPGF